MILLLLLCQGKHTWRDCKHILRERKKSNKNKEKNKNKKKNHLESLCPTREVKLSICLDEASKLKKKKNFNLHFMLVLCVFMEKFWGYFYLFIENTF